MGKRADRNLLERFFCTPIAFSECGSGSPCVKSCCDHSRLLPKPYQVSFKDAREAVAAPEHQLSFHAARLPEIGWRELGAVGSAAARVKVRSENATFPVPSLRVLATKIEQLLKLTVCVVNVTYALGHL